MLLHLSLSCMTVKFIVDGTCVVRQEAEFGILETEKECLMR